jgi:molybdopterin biosynthesis enzyme
MAIKFGKLTVEMSANVAGLSRDLAEAKNVSVRNFGLIKDAAESVNTRLSLIFGSQIVGHLIGVGRAGVAAFQSIKHSAIDTADELNKLSQKTGFSVESLSGLKYAAQLADVSLVGLTKGLKSLSINMVDARGGNRDLVETFRRLGISLEDPETALMQRPPG